MASIPNIPASTVNQQSREPELSQSNPLAAAPAFDMAGGAISKPPTDASHQQPTMTTTTTKTTTTLPPGSGLVQPPQLHTPLASEPADQWASSTLQQVVDEQKRDAHTTGKDNSTLGTASGPSTPGPHVPGAYPSLLPSSDTVAADLAYAKEVAASALGTAAQYVQAGLGAAKGPATNAANVTAEKAAELGSSAGQTLAAGANVAGGKAAELGSSAGQTLVAGATTAANVTADTTKSAANTTGQTLASGANTTAETARSAANTTGQTLASGANTTAEGAKSAASTTGQTLAAVPQATVNTARSAGQTLAAAPSTLASGVAAAPSSLVETVKQYLPESVASYLPASPQPQASHSTAVTDPTGNPKNGLEALDGTSLAKLPEEAMAPAGSGLITVANPTGNEKNGLEGVSGTGLAKLPEERHTEGGLPSSHEHSKLGATGLNQPGAISYDPSTQNKGFTASDLNPNLVVAPGSSANAPRDDHNGPSTHHPVGLHESTHLPAGSLGHGGANALHPSSNNVPNQPLHKSEGVFAGSALGGAESHVVGGKEAHHGADAGAHRGLGGRAEDRHVVGGGEEHHGADANASIKTLVGSTKGGERDEYRGTFENKPLNEEHRPKENAHVETLRAHDADKKPGVADTFVSSAEKKAVHPTGQAPAVPAKDDGSAHLPRAGASSDHGRSASTGSGEKKSGFLSKMKGEMKVISGKMTGKEEKVAEGRALLGKN